MPEQTNAGVADRAPLKCLYFKGVSGRRTGLKSPVQQNNLIYEKQKQTHAGVAEWQTHRT